MDCKPEAKVLDVGCGNGALSYKLQEKWFSVTGLDSSEDLLQIARHNYPEVNFVKADVVNFSLDETFDAVFSNAVFHWIDAKDQDCLLKSIFKVLKPKGQLVFEMGGSGNNALIHRQLANIFTQKGYAYKNPFYQKRSAAKTPSFRAEIIARRSSVFNQVFSAGQYVQDNRYRSSCG